MKVTWWGHATVAVEDSGTTVLTDPVLRDRLAHLRRRRGPTPQLTTAPDAVVISHLHADHCDLVSLRRLPPSTTLIVPRGAAPFVRRRLGGLGPRTVVDLGVDEETTVGSVGIRAVPAKHDGCRTPGSRLRAPALGYLISGRRTAWFGGDTGLFDGMSAFGQVDLALVPIWGWGWSLGPGHLDPWGAAEAVRRVAPAFAVPIHWGTLWPIGCLRVRPDRFTEPGAEFVRFAAERAPGTKVQVLAPGGSYTLDSARSMP